MKRFLSNDSITGEGEEVHQHKKRKTSNSIFNSDDNSNGDVVPQKFLLKIKKKKIKKKRKNVIQKAGSPWSISDWTTVSLHENLEECNDSPSVEEPIIIKEEFINPFSDDEEIFVNDENLKLQTIKCKEEPQSYEDLPIEKFESSKLETCKKKKNRKLKNSHDKSVNNLKVKAQKRNKKEFKKESTTKSEFESADYVDFEEALEHCTNSHEKSQLVERTKIEKKTEELTFGEITLLKQLKIEIPWLVPICHRIETRVSSYPTKEQKEQFATLEIKFSTGPYSNEENERIKENWSEFCKSHYIPENPKLFLNFVWEGKAYLHKEQRINFVRYLAKDLDHRPLWSIYERFQRLFSATQRGNFTSKEDDIIMAFYENSDFANKNSALASVLNRSRVSIKNRYSILKSEDSKIKFTNEMDQTFLDHLMAVTGKTSISELKDIELHSDQYKEIASKMNMHYTKLKRRWELVLKLRLFVEEYKFVKDIREKLINLLSESNLTDRREINWKQLAKHFENVTSSKLYKVFSDLKSTYVPEHRQKTLTDIIDCLKESEEHMANKKLRKYNYEGKKLIFETSK